MEKPNNILNENLIKACHDNDLVYIRYLLDIGADVHYRENSCLNTSIYAKNKAVVEILLQSDIDIHLNNEASLLIATMLQDISIMQLLIDLGADPICNSSYIINTAAKMGLLDSIQFFVNYCNVDIDIISQVDNIDQNVEQWILLLKEKKNLHDSFNLKLTPKDDKIENNRSIKKI